MELKIFIFCLLIMSALLSNSQPPIDPFKKSDVLSVVEREVKKAYADFSVTNFDRIVLSGKASGEYLISFSNSINYFPWRMTIYHSAAFIFKFVKKNGGTKIEISMSTTPMISTDEFTSKSPVFYVPSKSNDETIKRILNAAKISAIAENEVCFIYENPEEFEVTVTNDSVEGFWVINKRDFSVANQGHNTLAPPPAEKSEWVKIDWK